MQKFLLIIPCLFLYSFLHAQDTNTMLKATVIHSHQVKVGASLQYETGGGRYDYEYDYYYNTGSHYGFSSYYDGPNTQVFVSYEHIWTYANSLALAIEPKIGMSFREYRSNGFFGANWKFYWVTKDFWRMGIYLFTAYEYDQSTRSIYVNKDNGMYSQLIDITLNQHIFSSDIGFTPFQFKLRSAPVIIECNMNIIGLHVFWTRSNEYDTSDETTARLKRSNVGVYGPKIELKVGWQIK